jgi:hypothetical protein
LNGTSSLFEIQFSLKLWSFIEFIVTQKNKINIPHTIGLKIKTLFQGNPNNQGFSNNAKSFPHIFYKKLVLILLIYFDKIIQYSIAPNIGYKYLKPLLFMFQRIS